MGAAISMNLTISRPRIGKRVSDATVNVSEDGELSKLRLSNLQWPDWAEKVVIFQRRHHWKYLEMLDEPESAAIAAMGRS
jgi:hypothetical protein